MSKFQIGDQVQWNICPTAQVPTLKQGTVTALVPANTTLTRAALAAQALPAAAIDLLAEHILLNQRTSVSREDRYIVSVPDGGFPYLADAPEIQPSDHTTTPPAPTSAPRPLPVVNLEARSFARIAQVVGESPGLTLSQLFAAARPSGRFIHLAAFEGVIALRERDDRCGSYRAYLPSVAERL